MASLTYWLILTVALCNFKCVFLYLWNRKILDSFQKRGYRLDKDSVRPGVFLESGLPAFSASPFSFFSLLFVSCRNCDILNSLALNLCLPLWNFSSFMFPVRVMPLFDSHFSEASRSLWNFTAVVQQFDFMSSEFYVVIRFCFVENTYERL